MTEDSVGTGNYLSSDKSLSTCAKRQLLGTYQQDKVLNMHQNDTLEEVKKEKTVLCSFCI